MKARVKATGEIVEVRRICQSSQGPIWDAGVCEYYEHELDFDVKEPPKPPYDPDYWTRLEHQYAGMAMQGMIRTVGHNIMYKPEKIAIYAEACAHALVEKMKEERK